MAKLSLYHYDGCYYCHLVRDAMARLGVVLEERNILADPQHRRDLREARGRSRVPVLRIDHADGSVEWMSESRDIIRYLRAEFSDSNGPACFR